MISTLVSGSRGRYRAAPAPPGVAGPPGRGGELVLAGAHGGAGTSTLAVLLWPAWDLGAARRGAAGYPLIRAGGRPVVLVARGTPAGAGRAVSVANAVIGNGGRIAVLAVVSDGLPETAEARYRFRLLQARTGSLVRVPFVAALRLGGEPRQVELPRRARRALAEIRAQALRPDTRPAPPWTR